MISIIILTLNEEINLPACLESVRWSDDVVVFDSFSTDRTAEIARAAGARVIQRKFDDFAGQRNAALDTVAYKHPWIFHLDADERISVPLRRECEAVVSEDAFSCFLVPSKMMFMGRWLKHSGMYPSYQMRLLKKGEVCFIQKGHGQREGNALRGIGRLIEPYEHYCFSKGLDDWFEKHNRYSAREALECLKELNTGRFDLVNLLAVDPVKRRRALKLLSMRLPFRPAFRFMFMYFLRLGFLDGVPGLTYCRLLAWYEYMIVLKMSEIRRREIGIST